VSNKDFARDYLRRFPAATEADAIALEALLVMTSERGMAMAEWGSEEPTVRADEPFSTERGGA
jgi:hypothetical protein